MLESTRGLSGPKIVEWFINFEEERLVKQDELIGDSKFTMIIGFGGKSSRS
jgi:hypothetical protein